MHGHPRRPPGGGDWHARGGTRPRSWRRDVTYVQNDQHDLARTELSKGTASILVGSGKRSPGISQRDRGIYEVTHTEVTARVRWEAKIPSPQPPWVHDAPFFPGLGTRIGPPARAKAAGFLGISGRHRSRRRVARPGADLPSESADSPPWDGGAEAVRPTPAISGRESLPEPRDRRSSFPGRRGTDPGRPLA
jgi:hypothetical protein